MDVALRTLLRELALEVGDEIYDWLLRLLHGSYSRAEQKTIARTIVELARGHPAFDKIMRALAMILRILGIPMPSLARPLLIGSGFRQRLLQCKLLCLHRIVVADREALERTFQGLCHDAKCIHRLLLYRRISK